MGVSMWIHLPTTCCHCVPESVDLTSDLHSERLAEIAQSVTLNAKPTHARYWQNAWRKKPWMKHLYGLTYTHSMAAHGAASWIQSVAATRANRSAPPENDMVQMIRATYGRQLFESLKKSNRELCFSKMCPATLHSDSTRFAKIWTDWVSTLRRVCSARRKSARIMNANGCSSSGWHTPRASMAGNENPATFVTRNADRSPECFPGLPAQAERWPTPMVADSECATTGINQQFPMLAQIASKWPTPIATLHKSQGISKSRKNQKPFLLNVVAETWQTPCVSSANGAWHPKTGKDYRHLNTTAELWKMPTEFHCSRPAQKISNNGNESSATTPIARPRLNPNFTEWLMGFPIGWTDCAHAETPCSHWWPRMRSRLCFLLSQQIRDDIHQTLFDD